MKANTFFAAIFFPLVIAFSPAATAAPTSTNCVKVKIFTKNKITPYTERHTFVIHFQLENCGNFDLPIDFYGNLGYPEDSAANIYFLLQKADSKGRYIDYKFDRVDYKNIVDSIIRLKPHKIYSFYLPLFQVYGIKDPGTYRIQGLYRFINDQGLYIIQKSDPLDIIIKWV